MVRLDRDDGRLEDVSRFIADLNRVPEHHIGYLSLDPAGVLHELREMVPGTSEMLSATDNGAMVGVLGFDADPRVAAPGSTAPSPPMRDGRRQPTNFGT